jgi:hypothetical protein
MPKKKIVVRHGFQNDRCVGGTTLLLRPMEGGMPRNRTFLPLRVHAVKRSEHSVSFVDRLVKRQNTLKISARGQWQEFIFKKFVEFVVEFHAAILPHGRRQGKIIQEGVGRDSECKTLYWQENFCLHTGPFFPKHVLTEGQVKLIAAVAG